MFILGENEEKRREKKEEEPEGSNTKSMRSFKVVVKMGDGDGETQKKRVRNSWKFGLGENRKFSHFKKSMHHVVYEEKH